MDERYELYHHGTKGMKWGVRRYQNKDGSLTAAGRKRYGSGKAGDSIRSAAKKAGDKLAARSAAKKEAKRIEKLMKNPIRKLSEAELKERIDRTNKEKQLKDAERQSRQLSADGQAFVKKFGSKMLNEAAVPAAISAGKSALTKLLTNSLEKSLGVGGDDVKNSMELLKKPLSELNDSQIKALSKRYENILTIKKGRNAEKDIDKDTGNSKGDNSSDSDDDDDKD